MTQPAESSITASKEHTRPLDRLRAFAAGRDPFPLVVTAVSLAVFLVCGWLGQLSRDLSVYVYAGQQVLHGHAPYEAILNRAGPLAHLVPAVGIALGRLVGLSDVVGVRLFFMVISVVTVVSIYFWGRVVFASRKAGLTAAAAMLCFHGFIDYATNGPREKTVMILLFVWFLIDLHKRNWFRAGVWLALSTLTLQIIFPPGAVAALAALALAGAGERLRGLIRFAAGGLSATAVFVVYFAAVGALNEAIDAFWRINARYTTPDPLLSHPGSAWRDLGSGYGASLAVMVVGAIALVAAGVAAALTWRRPTSDPTAARLRAVFPESCAVVACTLWCLKDFDNWPDAFPLLPLSALGIGLCVAAITGRVAARLGGVIVAVAVVLAVSDAFAYAIGDRDNTLVREHDLADAVVRPLPADATFFSVNAPQVAVLTGRDLISRYVVYTSGIGTYLDHAYPGGLVGLGRWVKRKDPTVITVGKHYAVPPWLRPVLEAAYVKVPAPRWRIYLAKSAGDDVHARMVRNVRRVLAHSDTR